ncbi:EAL domain-containing protein [Caldibacillus lycopersici]|uniref:EAL domain-containing protein n=1 Tax=Perspicuibacillus lycopersici TaxID=1325689 RepID=A0AAE3IS18_9BACI|nr:EAL domain-containing protein [Perspicuibacillus lycopersici]MCU9613426.1 EAL domain-containing protein [Perspicuibacillus lycopersici]
MFTLPKSQDIYILHEEYSVSIILLSIIISCCAAYTAISLNKRVQQTSFFHKRFWLLLSSVAMGLGIWAMHFIGMSALMLPISMEYDLFLTIISAFPAIIASYLAFYFSNQSRARKSNISIIIAGIIMGVGITSMHYIGMAAMEMEADYIYQPWIFLASIMIAIVVSYIALYIFSTLQKYMGNQLIKIITSILMGLAITSMHYTGMAAIIFYVNEPLHGGIHQMHPMDMSLLIIGVTVGIIILLIVSGLTSLLDRYVEHRLNYFDALTVLPNQRQFEIDGRNMREAGSLAIIQIHQLEKWIVGYGYAFTDEMIKEVSEIIQQLKPASAKVYRIEEHRFAILNHDEQNFERMKIALERIMSVLMSPLIISNRRIIVDAVGAIARASNKNESSELFSHAMAVLGHSSTRYKHELIEYDPKIHTYSFENRIIKDIASAIANNELFLEYQPKICSKTQTVTGLEALLRWRHPEFGLISPGIFIPVLEESNNIYDVTDWVVREVCQQIAYWVADDVPFIQVSINIPGSYITSSRLLSVIKDNLYKNKINPSYLELEITETSVIHDIENAITAVRNYRDLGISVALDDFGTGLSSLSYLRKIPISTIKIDKSFVDGVPVSKKDCALLKAIITLCYSLNLKVVIEGVEFKEQIDFITSMTEIPLVQGYFYSRPLQVKELVAWLQEKTPIKSM